MAHEQNVCHAHFMSGVNARERNAGYSPLISNYSSASKYLLAYSNVVLERYCPCTYKVMNQCNFDTVILLFARLLMNAIIKHIPPNGYASFIKFCSVLHTQDFYRGYVRSVVVFYAIHQNDDYIQTHVNVELLSEVFQQQGQLNSREAILLSVEVGEKYAGGISREQYFIKLLRSKCPQFHLDFLETLSKEGSLFDLHVRISKSIDDLMTTIVKTSQNVTPLPCNRPSAKNGVRNPLSSPLHFYSCHLKEMYTQSIKVLAEDWPPNPHMHFINLALVTLTKRQKESKPHTYSILFNQEKNYKLEMLNDPKQIFDYKKQGHQVILIEGNAGSGKTTLAHKLCKDWAENSALLEFSHVILLKLRDQRIAKSKSLNDIISLQLGRPALDVVEEMVACFGAGFAIWLEGWDELIDSQKSESVFSDLISGILLPQAVIVLTTRPSAIGSLQDDWITRRIEILGFNEKQMDEYINRSFSNDYDNLSTSDGESFKKELKRVPNLMTLAFIPLSLCILVHVFKFHQHQLPSTLTEVYMNFLLITFQRHKERTTGDKRPLRSLKKLPTGLLKVLMALQQLAYDSLLREQLTFSDEEISDVLFDSEDIPWNFDGMGLFEVHQLELLTGVSRSFNFLHKTVQELLAALYLYQMSAEKQNHELKRLFGDPRFEMVWLFYAGVTEMKLFLPKKVLPSVVIECTLPELNPGAHRSLTAIWEASHSHYTTLTSKFVSEQFLLTLIICCYESQNPQLCIAICDHFYQLDTCCIDIPTSSAMPHVMLSLSYFMAHTNKKWSFYCGVQITSGIQLLYKYLSKPGVSGQLWRFCYIVSPSEKDDLCLLVQSQSHLQWLYLSFSASMGDEGAKQLCSNLATNTTIMKLHLNHCKINTEGLAAASQMLKSNKTIQQLDIRDNLYSAKDLISFLKNIKYYNRSLRDLFLDKKYETHPKITEYRNDINTYRKNNEIQELAYWFA